MAGIFLTPALLFHFFGANIQLPFLKMVIKLCKKVLLPVGKFLAEQTKEIYIFSFLLLLAWSNERFIPHNNR